MAIRDRIIVASRALYPGALQRLYQEALQTLPIPPSYARISFVWQGIPSPDLTNAKDISGYELQCEERGIGPHSEVTLEHIVGTRQSAHVQGRLAHRVNIITGTSVYDEANKLLVPVQSVSGDFQKFMDDFYKVLIDNDYQIGSGRILWAPQKQASYFGWEDLNYNWGLSLGNDLELHQPPEGHSGLSNEKVDKLIEWFSELKRRYQVQEPSG